MVSRAPLCYQHTFLPFSLYPGGNIKDYTNSVCVMADLLISKADIDIFSSVKTSRDYLHYTGRLFIQVAPELALSLQFSFYVYL